jgi:hypothetical protein
MKVGVMNQRTKLSFLLIVLAAGSARADVLFQGDAVVTHPGGVDIIAMSDPLCTGGTLGGTWAAASYPLISSAELGGDRVFGVALRPNLSTGATDIYLTASSGWGQQFGATQRVYKIDGDNGTPTVWADLGLASGPGLGQIVYNSDDDVFYVSNFADGRVHVLGADPATGAAQTLGAYDPRFPWTNFPSGMAPLGERVFGLGYNAAERRLYYSLWITDHAVPQKGRSNYVFSVPVYADGRLPVNERPVGWPPELVAWPEFQIPHNPLAGFSSPVSDIAFDETGRRMYLASRPMSGDHALTPGNARVDLYEGENRGWERDSDGVQVGRGGLDACGGITFDPSPPSACNDGPHVVVTGCSQAGSASLQTVPADGGSYLEGFFTTLNTSLAGDVDICTWCPPRQINEIQCADDLDNDRDGTVDCDDEDCRNDGACTLGGSTLSSIRYSNRGCTYTHGYWSTHSTDAIYPNCRPWPLPEDTLLCGETWLAHASRLPGDYLNIIAQQWVSAHLNVAMGARADWLVTWALLVAEDAMRDCVIARAEADLAFLAKDILDSFNQGLLGTPHCELPHGSQVCRPGRR